MTVNKEKVVVIGWQPLSRRGESFSHYIEAPFYLIHYLKFKYPPIAPIKYLLQGGKTMEILLRERPGYLIVENPPGVLPVLAYLYAKVFRAQFLIDAATGAFFDPRWKWMKPIFKFVSRRAFATIVTNNGLGEILTDWGSRPYILEDRIPSLPEASDFGLKKGFNIAVVNTFSFDEPVKEILAAANLTPEANFYITGNTAHASKEMIAAAPSNVTFTGYLPDSDYYSLLRSAAAVMVLCTVDYTLCCGMYEAASLNKPLIASDLSVVRAFFNRGTVHVRNTPEGISEGVRNTINQVDKLEEDMAQFRSERRIEWDQKCDSLLGMMKDKYVAR